jgi:two-component sensor histidine kinase
MTGSHEVVGSIPISSTSRPVMTFSGTITGFFLKQGKMIKDVFMRPWLQRKLGNVSGNKEYHVSQTLVTMLIVFPIAFLIFILTRLDLRDYFTIGILLAGLALILLFIYFGLARSRQYAVFLVSLTLTFMATVICTRGQGIHDITIVSYPAILILSILVLKKKEFIVLTIVNLMAILWLTLGGKYQLFIPRGHDAGTFDDFVVVSTIILIAAIFSYLSSDSLKRALDNAQNEIAKRVEIEAELKTSLKEKNSLLQEIHHRVKNNLSIICSLLNLQQAMSQQNIEDAFKEIKHRIMTMALVHEQLYRSEDLSHINMQSYIRQLTNQLLDVYDQNHQIQVNQEIEPLVFDIQTALPCGMIFNELITNVFKHAFQNRKDGRLDVTLKRAKDRCLLAVQDNGPGLQWKTLPEEPKSLGLSLISILTRQLEGKLSLANENGACIQIEFPLRSPRGIKTVSK